MHIRTKGEGYQLVFNSDGNPAVHYRITHSQSTNEITINSRKELIHLRDLIDEIINKEDGEIAQRDLIHGDQWEIKETRGHGHVSTELIFKRGCIHTEPNGVTSILLDKSEFKQLGQDCLNYAFLALPRKTKTPENTTQPQPFNRFAELDY